MERRAAPVSPLCRLLLLINLIVDALLALGRNLNLDVIAEGIETAAQAAFLAARGCGAGQGYQFSQPLPPESFTAASGPRGNHAGAAELSWART